MANGVPAGFTERLYAPGILRAVELLELIAGKPTVVERAQFLIDAIAITDAAVVSLGEEAANPTKTWAVAVIQFTQASGAGRYDITGGQPTAGGRGVQIPSGGGQLVIRGAENIRRFLVIGETGAVLEMSGFLFTSPVWANVQQ